MAEEKYQLYIDGDLYSDSQMTKDEIIDYLLGRLSKACCFYYTIRKVEENEEKCSYCGSTDFNIGWRDGKIQKSCAQCGEYR